MFLYFIENFERYRKSYFCPVAGCRSTRAVKKISNHLIQVHGIRDPKRRAELIKSARSLGPQVAQRMKVQVTITQAMSTNKRQTTLIRPKVQAKKGSTNQYPRFCVDTEPLMLDFITNLTSFDGGFKSAQEARQIAQDVSKYLAHADPSSARWSVATNQEKLKSFVEKLEGSGVGPNGICTKIDRLVTALQYTTRTSLLPPDQCATTISRLKSWKGSFSRQKFSKALEKAIVEGTDGDEQVLSTVNAFLQCPEMKVCCAHSIVYNFISIHLLRVTWRNGSPVKRVRTITP